MDDIRYAGLKVDIETHGQQEPITLCDGKILDGRNRYRACIELNIPPITRVFVGDPWAHVWSRNGERRDLSEDQRAQIYLYVRCQSEEYQRQQEEAKAAANAKRSEAAKEGRVGRASKKFSSGTQCPTTKPEPDRHKTKHALAAEAGVNAGAIARAAKLATNYPVLATKVRLGELKPAEARRQAKRAEVAEKVASLPSQKFTVIYADPPWSYNDKQSGTISESYGAAEKHYPSMSMAELKALDVRSLAADNSVLFLWATSPLLPEGLELSRAWGFAYKASFVWDKVKHNMGHYNSVRHEFLLLATRGSCTPQISRLFDSVQSIERTGHSEKPEQFREIIETLYPKGHKIELFARKKSNGWSVWGNEA